MMFFMSFFTLVISVPLIAFPLPVYVRLILYLALWTLGR